MGEPSHPNPNPNPNPNTNLNTNANSRMHKLSVTETRDSNTCKRRTGSIAWHYQRGR